MPCVTGHDRSITAAKRKEKKEKERQKKTTNKCEKPKDVGHFLIQISKIPILISAKALVR